MLLRSVVQVAKGSRHQSVDSLVGNLADPWWLVVWLLLLLSRLARDLQVHDLNFFGKVFRHAEVVSTESVASILCNFLPLDDQSRQSLARHLIVAEREVVGIFFCGFFRFSRVATFSFLLRLRGGVVLDLGLSYDEQFTVPKQGCPVEELLALVVDLVKLADLDGLTLHVELDSCAGLTRLGQ